VGKRRIEFNRKSSVLPIMKGHAQPIVIRTYTNLVGPYVLYWVGVEDSDISAVFSHGHRKYIISY
jgi:hypothetical protein